MQAHNLLSSTSTIANLSGGSTTARRASNVSITTPDATDFMPVHSGAHPTQLDKARHFQEVFSCPQDLEIKSMVDDLCKSLADLQKAKGIWEDIQRKGLKLTEGLQSCRDETHKAGDKLEAINKTLLNLSATGMNDLAGEKENFEIEKRKLEFRLRAFDEKTLREQIDENDQHLSAASTDKLTIREGIEKQFKLLANTIEHVSDAQMDRLMFASDYWGVPQTVWLDFVKSGLDRSDLPSETRGKLLLRLANLPAAYHLAVREKADALVNEYLQPDGKKSGLLTPEQHEKLGDRVAFVNAKAALGKAVEDVRESIYGDNGARVHRLNEMPAQINHGEQRFEREKRNCDELEKKWQTLVDEYVLSDDPARKTELDKQALHLAENIKKTMRQVLAAEMNLEKFKDSLQELKEGGAAGQIAHDANEPDTREVSPLALEAMHHAIQELGPLLLKMPLSDVRSLSQMFAGVTAAERAFLDVVKSGLKNTRATDTECRAAWLKMLCEVHVNWSMPGYGLAMRFLYSKTEGRLSAGRAYMKNLSEKGGTELQAMLQHAAGERIKWVIQELTQNLTNPDPLVRKAMHELAFVHLSGGEGLAELGKLVHTLSKEEVRELGKLLMLEHADDMVDVTTGLINTYVKHRDGTSKEAKQLKAGIIPSAWVRTLETIKTRLFGRSDTTVVPFSG